MDIMGSYHFSTRSLLPAQLPLGDLPHDGLWAAPNEQEWSLILGRTEREYFFLNVANTSDIPKETQHWPPPYVDFSLIEKSSQTWASSAESLFSTDYIMRSSKSSPISDDLSRLGFLQLQDPWNTDHTATRLP